MAPWGSPLPSHSPHPTRKSCPQQCQGGGFVVAGSRWGSCPVGKETLPPDSSTLQGCHFLIHSIILGSGTVGTEAQPPRNPAPTQRCFYHRISPNLPHWSSQPCKISITPSYPTCSISPLPLGSFGRCQSLGPIISHPPGLSTHVQVGSCCLWNSLQLVSLVGRAAVNQLRA